jgi:hypothetical protein
MSFSCMVGYLTTTTKHPLFGQFQKRRSRKFTCSILHRSPLRAARRPSEGLRPRSGGSTVVVLDGYAAVCML